MALGFATPFLPPFVYHKPLTMHALSGCVLVVAAAVCAVVTATLQFLTVGPFLSSWVPD